jgi:hypothetical protein
MDQRIEAFLADVLALAGEEPDAVRDRRARRPRGLRGDLPGTGDAQTHEGQGGSRMPRAVPCSLGRGDTTAQGNATRRSLEARAERHRPAAAKLLTREGLW